MSNDLHDSLQKRDAKRPPKIKEKTSLQNRKLTLLSKVDEVITDKDNSSVFATESHNKEIAILVVVKGKSSWNCILLGFFIFLVDSLVAGDNIK